LGVGSAINFVAMATYDSNRVEDISAKAKWQITDRGVIDLQEKGRFLTKSQGIAEVTAELDNFQSLPAKVIVFQGQAMAAFGEPSDLNKTAEEKEKKEEKKEENKGSSDLSKEIKKEVEKIAKNAVAKGDKLILIKIIPDYLNIPLGEKSKLSAMGVYSNHSEEDLTLFTDWRSSDKTIAAVSAGEVSTFSMGKVKVFAKFRGLESAPASVTVEGPKLISIVIFPQNTRITIENKLSLKAEGHFSDSSVQDITSLVSWEVSNPRIIRIEKAIAYALDIGKTQVFAQYSGVRSLPANIRVIFTLSWLLKRIFAIILFLILTTTLVLFAFYLMTKMAKKRLLSLYKNPREFILNLYVNTKALLDIFGKRIKEILPPLSYARLVEERHSVKDNSFLRFTVKFEEAKYSKHILGSEDVDTALNDYNSLLMAIFSNQKRFSLLLRYCATLLHRRPLFIHIHK
jgi:hypothetical protein